MRILAQPWLTKGLPALAFGLGTLMVAGSAQAQDEEMVFGDDDGFVFEEEEVMEVTAPSTSAARYLQDGITYYEAEDFLAASGFFWRVVNDPDISVDSIRPRAQFELAKTLVRMRLLQGALLFFDEIILEGPGHPYFEASAEWMIVIARRLPGDAEMLRRISNFADLFPDRIEEKYRDELAYYLGEHYFNIGEREQALQYLGFVTSVSDFYTQAQFLAGITHVRLGQAREAIAKFEMVMDLTRRGDAESRRLNELAQLSLARTYYGAGDFERAEELYSEIPRNSEYWLDSLFESSWAFYQSEQFNRALGNLHSLNSPFFNDEYYPEAPVLQAVILFYNCRWREVAGVIEEFDFTFGPLLDQLRATMAGLADDQAFYNFLRESAEQQGGRRFDPRLQQIVGVTLDVRSIRQAVAFIDELDREMGYIQNEDAGWSQSDLGQFLYNEVLATRDFAVAEAGALVRGRLSGILEELERHDRSMTSVEVETQLAEADQISPELRAELFRGESIDDVSTASSEYMVWTFDGEYWKDELGYYYYHVNSRCE
jgi:tetratricopeptide (TPR) repeat protein